MAQNTTTNIPAATWTQLTNADVTKITFQNITGHPIFVKGTTDGTAPTTDAGAVRYNPGQGERNAFLSDLFPGIAAARVWAYCDNGARVVVSHA